jgi:Putative adhesin
MTDIRTETFDTPAPITVRVDQAAGTLDVRAEPTATTTVELRRERGSEQVLERTRVELRGDELVIDVPNRLFRNAHLAITVVVPEGSGVIAELAATDLICRGTLGTLRTTTASGDVQADDVTGDVQAHSASGDVAVGQVGGSASLRSLSGDVALRGAAGNIDANSASGDLAIGSAGASVRARTASGDIGIAVARQGSVEVDSASGDVSVGVAPGVGVWLDVSTMSGTTDTNLAVGDQPPATGCDLRITARSMSGDIEIRRAAATV